MTGSIRYDPLAVGLRCLKKSSGAQPPNRRVYTGWILILTFIVYMSYHMNRKCMSVVKSTLNGDQNNSAENPGWAPFNTEKGTKYLGYLDTAFLLSYAFAIFLWGHVADVMSLRYFLTLGMIGTAVTTVLYGMADFWKIHSLAYFVIMQLIIGAFQATGWPAVVALIGNWVDKGSRGFIMGIWNSHTSVGNILGNILAGSQADSIKTWGLSFVYPAIIIGGLSIVVFFFLPTTPQAVGLPPPKQAGSDEEEENLIRSLQHQGYDSNEEEQDVDPNTIPAISFCKALMLPSVLEFSCSLFFTKLVCYTFMFCLPNYVSIITIGGTHQTTEKSADIANFYDIGGCLGSILIGLLADKTRCNAILSITFQLTSVPLLYVYYTYGGESMTAQLCIMFVVGFFSNGPYALITTAVSTDLATQESLRGNAQALATVSAIIDGIGSIGATIGPYLTSLLVSGDSDTVKDTEYGHVFYMLMASSGLASLCLIRVMVKEIRNIRLRRIRHGIISSIQVEVPRRGV